MGRYYRGPSFRRSRRSLGRGQAGAGTPEGAGNAEGGVGGERSVVSGLPELIVLDANILVRVSGWGSWKQLIRLHGKEAEIVTVEPALVEGVKNVEFLRGKEKALELLYNFFGLDSNGQKQPIRAFQSVPLLEFYADILLGGAAQSDWRVVAAVLGMPQSISVKRVFVTEDTTLLRALRKHSTHLEEQWNLVVMDPLEVLKLYGKVK